MYVHERRKTAIQSKRQLKCNFFFCLILFFLTLTVTTASLAIVFLDLIIIPATLFDDLLFILIFGELLVANRASLNSLYRTHFRYFQRLTNFHHNLLLLTVLPISHMSPTTPNIKRKYPYYTSDFSNNKSPVHNDLFIYL